ncbi:MAG TPA: hypothetical protein VKB50_22475 [Vicinamibacterales bacterium]|nr:hypothetical protein [Vicinamibacterales bacterium]
MKASGFVVLAASVLVGHVLLDVPATAADRPCDRACLEGIAENYLAALVAKDPTKLPLGRGVKYTENGQRLHFGDGFWNSVTGRGKYTLHVADVTAGQIVTFATMRETRQPEGRGGPPRVAPMIMAVRLKVDDLRLTEVETLLAHSEGGAMNLEARGTPRASFSRATPPADRASRADLVRVANMYFSGMQLNDGKGTYPFADDCDRIENGGQTTNGPGRDGGPKPDPKASSNYSAMWSCREQFESGLLHFVSRIRDRRYVAVDEERGLVVAFAFFDHDAGASRHFKTPDGRDVTAGPVEPWTWEIAELFKVEKGLLHEIEAVLERAPYGMNSGWSSYEDGMSDKIQFAK